MAERDIFARKLGHRGPAPATRRPVPVTEVRQVTREVVETQPPAQSAAEIIRGRHAQLQDTAKRRRLARYLETGRVAMEAGDYRAAAAAYEQAARLSPDDEEIRQKASEASSLALLR